MCTIHVLLCFIFRAILFAFGARFAVGARAAVAARCRAVRNKMQNDFIVNTSKFEAHE